MGNRKKDMEAFEQVFKKKTNPFGQGNPGKGGSSSAAAKSSPAKGGQLKSTRSAGRGV